MGLFGKKEPCAYCGGKVGGLFPSKIQGRLVCSDCYGIVDLPDGMEKQMSLEDFQGYRQFRAENQMLKADFVRSGMVDMGLLDTKLVYDLTNGRFCFDKNLNKTIFLGRDLVEFQVREDGRPLYEGSRNGLISYGSDLPDRVHAMGPEIARMAAERERMDRMERERHGGPGGGPGGPGGGPGGPGGHPGGHRPMPIPEPMDKFQIELHFDHPYWRTMLIDYGGPRFDHHRPDVFQYLRDYQEKIARLEDLANALARVAFPEAPTLAPGETAAAAATAASATETDPAAEIKKYKALLDDGIITEEEFSAKKKQILGI